MQATFECFTIRPLLQVDIRNIQGSWAECAKLHIQSAPSSIPAGFLEDITDLKRMSERHEALVVIMESPEHFIQGILVVVPNKGNSSVGEVSVFSVLKPTSGSPSLTDLYEAMLRTTRSFLHDSGINGTPLAEMKYLYLSAGRFQRFVREILSVLDARYDSESEQYVIEVSPTPISAPV